MEDQSLQTDVPGRLYAYMVLNSPASMKDTELARYWIQKGVKAEISERRRETGDNLDLNQELARALDTYGERNDLESEYADSDG